MVDIIRSVYFIKMFVSYIYEGKKLDIIRYNKNLQKKLDINIINYKVYSKRYIIYDSKLKGKEYDSYNDNLLYEGEYLNVKRNGKGKEYNNGGLSFEGEYLNGKRNGKGKEYNFGILRFEGEYLNGERNGKGKEFFND